MDTISTTTLEWTGTVFTLLGALLLALDMRISRYGWIAFLIANLTAIFFSRAIDRNGLFTQTIGLTLTSLLGVYRSFVAAKRRPNASTEAHRERQYPRGPNQSFPWK
jgi:hypothetical protein